MADSLFSYLKSHGQSVTTARRKVFAALHNQEPVSMNELVSRCTDIDRASVYRTVALFESLGIITRLQTGWKYKLELSDAFHEHHHHATCLSCGRSIVLADSPALEHQMTALAAASDFHIERHQLELQGYCVNCMQAQLPLKKAR